MSLCKLPFIMESNGSVAKILQDPKGGTTSVQHHKP
jgi:hypothetical protein